jgi:hypothetical protein
MRAIVPVGMNRRYNCIKPESKWVDSMNTLFITSLELTGMNVYSAHKRGYSTTALHLNAIWHQLQSPHGSRAPWNKQFSITTESPTQFPCAEWKCTNYKTRERERASDRFSSAAPCAAALTQVHVNKFSIPFPPPGSDKVGEISIASARGSRRNWLVWCLRRGGSGRVPPLAPAVIILF